MREKLQEAIRKFRLAHPQTKKWEDDEVVEAMLLILSQEKGSRIAVVGREATGKVIFRINLAPDTSDGL